jgi:hypothetical protein
MRPEIKVYIAAKLEHAPKLAAIRQDGIHINARWIDMAEAARQRLKPVSHWQQENFDDIEAAHFFILYLEPGDKLKGALFELGYAVCAGKKCWIAGDGHGVEVPILDGAAESDMQMRLPHRDILPWCHYRQSIRVVLNLNQAFKEMNAITRTAETKNSNGVVLPMPTFETLPK